MMLSALEKEAMRRALAGLGATELKDALALQSERVSVVKRTYSSAGYYADFFVPACPADCSLSRAAVDLTIQAEARHPDGVNAIFFIFYLKNGEFEYMEASSTAEWPVDEGKIIFL